MSAAGQLGPNLAFCFGRCFAKASAKYLSFGVGLGFGVLTKLLQKQRNLGYEHRGFGTKASEKPNTKCHFVCSLTENILSFHTAELLIHTTLQIFNYSILGI